VKTGTENGALFLKIDGYPGIQTQLIGSLNVNNVLAALAFGEMFGVEREKAAAAIAAYKPSNNRSQWMETPYNALVVDAYNANPTSMAASLEDFKKLGATNKCLILGDMRELGDVSLQEHLKIVEYVRDMPVQQIFWVGPWFTKAAEQMRAPGLCFPNVEALIGHLKKHPLRHTTTLIKGSNGIRLTKIISSEVC
jgi:UDP-N-acetylmuramoyl-tripeptide--D-alanyl-D-alanine ligase